MTYKVPSSGTFELTRLAIILDHMQTWKTTSCLQKFPMQRKSMLNKKCVMDIVIKNIIVNFLKDLGVWVNKIIVWIAAIGNVNQNGHLEVMPMHILNFIMNFHGVIFR
jgi:hypothetical protein